MEAFEADKQKYILQFQTGGITNRGSGPDETLTMQEFMGNLDRRIGECTADPPGTGRDITQVAKELDAERFNGQLKPLVANRHLSGGDLYQKPIQHLPKMVPLALAEKPGNAAILNNLNSMKSISTTISSIRHPEFESYIPKD